MIMADWWPSVPVVISRDAIGGGSRSFFDETELGHGLLTEACSSSRRGTRSTI
jgi:hypothetical protein